MLMERSPVVEGPRSEARGTLSELRKSLGGWHVANRMPVMQEMASRAGSVPRRSTARRLVGAGGDLPLVVGPLGPLGAGGPLAELGDPPRVARVVGEDLGQPALARREL